MQKLDNQVGAGPQNEVPSHKHINGFQYFPDKPENYAKGIEYTADHEDYHGEQVCLEKIKAGWLFAFFGIRRSNHPRLEKPKSNVQRHGLPPETIKRKTSDDPGGQPQQEVDVGDDHREELGRPDQDEGGGDGEDAAGQKRLYSLVEGQHPRQAVVADERADGLVEERLQDAQLQPHPEQPAGDQRAVLGEVLGPHQRLGRLLQDPVQAVRGGADGLEGLRGQARALEAPEVDAAALRRREGALGGGRPACRGAGDQGG